MGGKHCGFNQPRPQRLVIGAHYDSVEGSTGANDNAAGVSVLIRLTEALFENTEDSVDLAFFDREEWPDKGSEQYIEQVGRENIRAMVNLDVCGYGRQIAVSAKGSRENPKFVHLMAQGVLDKHSVKILGILPPGDDVSFDAAEIPNVSVAVLPEGDSEVFEELADYLQRGEKLTQEKQGELFSRLKSLPTMHNGPKDSIETVCQESMDLLLDYLLEGLAVASYENHPK